MLIWKKCQPSGCFPSFLHNPVGSECTEIVFGGTEMVLGVRKWFFGVRKWFLNDYKSQPPDATLKQETTVMIFQPPDATFH